MIRLCARMLLVTAVLTLSVTPAMAQGTSDDLKVNIYPLLGWAPVFGADLPAVPVAPVGGGGSGSGGGSSSGGAIDSKLNGALMFGFDVEKGPWRVEADGMWAALHGDRPAAPKLNIDLDFIYAHANGGYAVYKDLYVTAGVRRLALSYTIQLANFPDLSRKPGVWDPLVGVAWHHVGKRVDLHAEFEGGGFGVGADQDIFGSVRVDLKPTTHLRIALGYAGIHVKLSDTVLGQTFTAAQTLQGPIVGIGFGF